ncbi:MAG TPA: (Fe-S)-binding protein, partial [Candidatus Eremiobacteraceae bacterium]|nr:(Fe-S)-binding protein [Candidatus Eremiobacteraceae bacterium]
QLLRGVRELRYAELGAGEECCGFGGLFAVKFERLSVSMGDAKCDRAVETGAEYLVSGDASCLMHVDGMLRRRGSALRTLHLAQVLASA